MTLQIDISVLMNDWGNRYKLKHMNKNVLESEDIGALFGPDDELRVKVEAQQGGGQKEE